MSQESCDIDCLSVLTRETEKICLEKTEEGVEDGGTCRASEDPSEERDQSR